MIDRWDSEANEICAAIGFNVGRTMIACALRMAHREGERGIGALQADRDSAVRSIAEAIRDRNAMADAADAADAANIQAQREKIAAQDEAQDLRSLALSLAEALAMVAAWKDVVSLVAPELGGLLTALYNAEAALSDQRLTALKGGV